MAGLRHFPFSPVQSREFMMDSRPRFDVAAKQRANSRLRFRGKQIDPHEGGCDGIGLVRDQHAACVVAAGCAAKSECDKQAEEGKQGALDNARAVRPPFNPFAMWRSPTRRPISMPSNLNRTNPVAADSGKKVLITSLSTLV